MARRKKVAKVADAARVEAVDDAESDSDVRKSSRMFVGGAFTRSESGRSYTPSGAPRTNVPRGSRNDVREAVGASRAALPGWSGRSAVQRGQILHRFAEMLQAHRATLAADVERGGGMRPDAQVDAAIDLVVWYAGLADKLQALLGSHDAVAVPFQVVSVVEPVGVVGIVAPDRPSLLGLCALLLPVIAAGNAAVVCVSETHPLAGLALGERLAVGDVPAGVVNLVSGLRAELVPALLAHRDVDGVLLGVPAIHGTATDTAAAADSVKRVRRVDLDAKGWRAHRPSLAFVEPFVEVKAIWQPTGIE